jgi:hypothetical protein
MARNRPAKHSDAQFALFVEQMKKMLDVEDDSEFDHAVRRLVGSDELQRSEAASSSSLAATLGDLPEPPDFDAIESAARETGASARAYPMVLVGHLAFGLLNNENLLIYILMALLQTDEPSAAIVFSILNTMRARLDLVSRLVWMRISDRTTRRAFDQVVTLFNRANQIRTEFLHAIHTMEGRGAIAHGEVTPAIEESGRVGFVQRHPIDQKRLDGMAKACRDMNSLNRRIWSICRGFGTRSRAR